MKIGIKVRASGIIFYGKKLVVTKHHAPNYGTYYLLPGGGVEHGESPEEAIIREVKEECGLEIVPERLIFYKSGYNEKEDYLDLIFLCKIKGGNLRVSNKEDKVKSIELISNKEELSKIRIFPKQIVNRVFKKLPREAEFLGKYKYPEA